LTLENGTKYPVVGLGTWLNTDDTNMYPLIKAALDAGINILKIRKYI